MEQDSFRQLLMRLQAGDGDAAAELVREYEPLVRREIRMRMRDPRLRRSLDSVDVAQSVLASFFANVGLKAYSINSPEELIRLLMVMARRNLYSKIRHERQEKRDHRRLAGVDVDVVVSANRDSTPSQWVANRELLQMIRDRMTNAERRIADLRSSDLSWDEIARREQRSAQACRMQLSRAIRRITEELGFESQ